MASLQASETSFFSLSDVRERMREKKNGALRTAKLNASLASKIRTKIINNSSTIKISLKHNNKALALALNAEKASVQRLTQEKMILQKEVEQCHFESAVLRHKVSFLNNILKEIENLAAGAKMAWLSEVHTSSASLSNGQKSSMTEDSWANDIADGQLARAGGMPLRVPISKLCGAGQERGSSTAVQTSSLNLQRSVSNEPLETVAVTSKDTLPPAEQPQSHQEENGKKLTEAMEAQEAFLGSGIFEEALCTTQQEPNNLPVLVRESHPLYEEGDEMAKHFFDHLSKGHVTQRRKRSTLSATSTPSSVVDIIPHVSSSQAALWSITKDSSNSCKNKTQPQPKSPSSLVSPTQTTVTPDKKSLAKKIFRDQPQAKEAGCAVEMDPRYSRVPEFVPIKVKSKGSCKTVEKKPVKKAITGKKKSNAVTNNAESSLDLPQNEDSAQNAEKLLQPKDATCSSESEVSEMGQKTSVGAFNRKNRGCDIEKDSCSADEVQDLRRTHEVNPAQPQLQSLQSGDLLQQVTKEAIFEIQSVDRMSKCLLGAFSSHEVPSDDSSLQNTLFLRKETSSACALQKDSSGNTKSIREKTNRRTRVIRQRDESEENLPNSVKIPGAKGGEQTKKSQSESPVGTFSSLEVPSDDCSLQNSLFLRKETSSACALQKDSSGNTKSIREKTNRRTRVIRQRDESEENLPNSVKIPGAKGDEQTKKSQSESPVGTFSSLEVPSDDCSLQNSLFLRKETSSACALQKDSSGNTKSIREKTNRRTRLIRQRDESEENLPNSVKLPGAKGDEQIKKSQSESPVGTFSSLEVPSDDCSLQNSLFLRKETSSACALQKDSSGNTKSIREKNIGRPGVIRQRRDESDEENLPNSVKIPGAKDEEQPKRSQMTRNKTVRKSSCSDQRNEVVLGPCIDVQRVAKESTKDSPRNLKRSRETYVVHTLDHAGNLDCVQTYFEGGEVVPHVSIPEKKASKIPRFQRREAAQSNKKKTGGLQEKQQARADNMNVLKKDSYPRLKPQQKRNTSSPPEADCLARQSDGTKTLTGSSAELASKQSVLMGKFSCITDLLSESDAFLKEQIAEVSLENNLMRVLHSLESSSVSCSAAPTVSSKLTDVSVSKNLSTEGNRMTEKSFVWLESSLIAKQMPAEEIPGRRNRFESNSWSSRSEEPEITQLQDLTNTRTLPSFSSEEALRRSSRWKRNTPCYAEPKINRKLRQGDPFTDMEFFHYSLLHKTKKKTAKAKGMPNKVKDTKHFLLEGCPSAKSNESIIMGRDMEPEVK